MLNWIQINLENEYLIKKRGIPTRKNMYYEGYKFFPNMNGDLKIMNAKDAKILEEWENGEYNPPVRICEI